MNNKYLIPNICWTFSSFGFMVFLIGAGYSISRANNYELELAQYKLQVGSKISDVQRTADKLQDTINAAPIAPKQKQQIKALTAEIDQATEEINLENN
jgi:predicted  nucleic acid-binding Zn-ribbon protein